MTPDFLYLSCLTSFTAFDSYLLAIDLFYFYKYFLNFSANKCCYFTAYYCTCLCFGYVGLYLRANLLVTNVLRANYFAQVVIYKCERERECVCVL